MTSPRKALATAVTLILAACTAQSPAGVPGAPAPLISDAAHGGTPGFYFLPPMVRPVPYGPTFSAGLSPEVHIDARAPGAAGWTALAAFTTSAGPDGVAVSERDDHYQVNWHTGRFDLDPAAAYRVRVLVEGRELGFADVDVVASGPELRDVDTAEHVALRAGRTLPIKFRIEPEALEGGEGLTHTLARSNVAELDGRVQVRVRVEPDRGDTRLTIQPVLVWPVTNPFLGWDRLFYGADAASHPVVRISDEGCDEVVVGGSACGWHVNDGGCTADGFGCFVSLGSSESGGQGGRTAPLVFWVQGSVDFLPNDLGARFALHGRFGPADGSMLGCSGWVSDGANLVTPTSDPGCVLSGP